MSSYQISTFVGFHKVFIPPFFSDFHLILSGYRTNSENSTRRHSICIGKPFSIDVFGPILFINSFHHVMISPDLVSSMRIGGYVGPIEILSKYNIEAASLNFTKYFSMIAKKLYNVAINENMMKDTNAIIEFWHSFMGQLNEYEAEKISYEVLSSLVFFFFGCSVLHL